MPKHPKYLPVYSDLPPTRDELLQLKLLDRERDQGSVQGPTPRSTFLDRPSAKPMEFGRSPNFRRDLNVIRHINQFMDDPEFASHYYKQVTKLQPLPIVMGKLYGALAGGLGAYAATGNGIAGSAGAAIGGGLGALVGLGRVRANRRIMDYAFRDMVPEAREVRPEEVTSARLYNKATAIAAPAVAGFAAVAALLRLAAEKTGSRGV
jgi:hypothetical protein